MDRFCRICGNDQQRLIPLNEKYRNILRNMHQTDFESLTLQICHYKCFNKFKEIHRKEYSRREKQRPKRMIHVIDWDYELKCPMRALRRSERVTKSKLLEKRQILIENHIVNQTQNGLAIKEFAVKGRGIVTTRPFKKDEFVLEYIGELIDVPEAESREKQYAMDVSKGCYSYYFCFNDTHYCIDATEESPYFGRLVNHSRYGNLVPKVVEFNGRPRIVFFAKEYIATDKEVTYDYGDRDKETLVHNPWLAQ